MDLLEKMLGGVSLILLGLATWWIRTWISEVKTDLRDLRAWQVKDRVEIAKLNERCKEK